MSGCPYHSEMFAHVMVWKPLGISIHGIACGTVRCFNSKGVTIAKNIVFVAFLYGAGKCIYRQVRIHGLKGTAIRWYGRTLQRAMTFLRCAVPAANKQVSKQISKAIADIEKDLVRHVEGVPSHKRLPKKGLGYSRVVSELEQCNNLLVPQSSWEKGQVSGAVYNGSSELQNLAEKAFRVFSVSNPLHPDVFPAVRRMEAEVVRMVIEMFHGNESCVGNLTSGGTESILLACLAYREYAYQKHGISRSLARIVVPSSVHAAFEKAASYFQMGITQVPIDAKSGKVSLSQLEAAIDRNTVLIVGSAPNFPHGIVDDIAALSEIAVRKNVPLHVDCCLGGFIAPFAEEAGFPLPHLFDFQLPGVTSISADTHKYGFAPKGSSVIMYRSSEYRQHQYYVTTEWSGGVYATPTLAGSRPGALIAGCWATMLYFGRAGYVESCKKIIGTARYIAEQIQQMPELTVIGDPRLSVVAFTSAGKLNIYAVAELLNQRGWHLNVLQNPGAIHIAVTLATCNADSAKSLVADLQQILKEMEKDPKAGHGAQAAIYGTVASVPDRTIVADVARGFLDALTKSV